MKCQLDRSKCIACGLCQIYAPDFFDYNDEGIVIFKDQPFDIIEKEVLPNETQAVTKSMKKCPTHALIPHV